MLIKGAIYKNKQTGSLERVKWDIGNQFVRTVTAASEAGDGLEEIVNVDSLESVDIREVEKYINEKRELNHGSKSWRPKV